MEPSRDIWVGTYTADSGRDGVGIGVLRLNGAGDAAAGAAATAEWLGRAVDAPSPSFLAVHPSLPVVYAVGERAETVAAYRRAAPSPVTAADQNAGIPALEPFGEPWPAGAAVCHIAVDPLGRYAVACCWGDGRVLLYELDAEGAIVDRFVGAAASDPHAEAAATERDVASMLARTGFAPRTSRAHCALVLPDGRIMTTDLGYDLVRVWTYVPGAGLALDHELELPLWSGPRHLVAHPNGSVLIVTEYSVEVVVLAPLGAAIGADADAPGALPTLAAGADGTDGTAGTAGVDGLGALADATAPAAAHAESAAGVEDARETAGRVGAELAPSGLPRYVVAEIVPATARGAQPFDAAAEITLSDDAHFVYVTVRGSNSVTTLRVDDRGHVHPLADVSTGGDWPRHHLVAGSALLIAHERSSQVTLFALDPDTGLPSGPTEQVAVKAPTALILA